MKIEKKIPVLTSSYSEEFENMKEEEVFLLSNEEAQIVWTKHIDSNATSYFKLPDANWVVCSKQVALGDWIRDFNEDKIETVQSMLNQAMPWKDTDKVWYCMSKVLILETTWLVFKQHWISFLQCDDDCPILINASQQKEAVLFRPVGDFLKIKKD